MADLVGNIVGGTYVVGQNFGGGAFGQIFMGTVPRIMFYWFL